MSCRRGLAAALTATAMLAVGGVAIAAAQPETSAGTSAETTAAPRSTDDDTASPAVRTGAGVLHGEYVVPDGDGGFRTQLVQVGEIESVDDQRLTVVSADGYERSYERTEDTVVGGADWSAQKNEDGSLTVRPDDADLSTGQAVRVVAALEGDTATAVRITPNARGAGELPDVLRERLGGIFGDRFGERFDGPLDDAFADGFLDRLHEDFFDGDFPEKFFRNAPGSDRFEFHGPKDRAGEAPSPSETSASDA